MAKQDVKTNDPQSKQGTETTRSSQSAGMMRWGGPSLADTLITPFDFFRVNPFSMMRRMADEMDRLFGEVRPAREAGGELLWSPAIEVSEAEGKCVIRAELAGLRPEDVKLEVDNDVLILEGERKSEHEEKKDDVHRTEIRYGRFYRRIPLPENASVDQARAKFENGVLEVTVPVPARESQRRQIPIQKASSASSAAS
ncbi:MAG TPA: Hsp20/alpha crystallin family protein [Bryobacteraceae bacterium]|jgi:Molecular chaperone (small heat shock protein)|nr:Hsp20/alpha crystallin family protein [Bryobacteraceae bacterium]